MATTFENILANAQRKGIVGRHNQEALQWFRNNVRKTAVNPNRILKEERDNYVNSWTNVGVGNVYFVMYDPKHKATLPYYDRFPCMIPFYRGPNHIKALNLHYLPPVLRARVMDQLFDIVNDDRFDSKTKMVLSYGKLKGLSTHPLMRPCIKMYLGNHFRSRFIKIPPQNWVPALFLPVEQFEKASKAQVWNDSRQMAKR